MRLVNLTRVLFKNLENPRIRAIPAKQRQLSLASCATVILYGAWPFSARASIELCHVIIDLSRAHKNGDRMRFRVRIELLEKRLCRQDEELTPAAGQGGLFTRPSPDCHQLTRRHAIQVGHIAYVCCSVVPLIPHFSYRPVNWYPRSGTGNFVTRFGGIQVSGRSPEGDCSTTS